MANRLDDPELCEHQREALLSPFPLGWFYFLPRRRCPECEREAHEAWIADVRAWFGEALFHLTHGLPVLPLDRYPCAKYPECDRSLGGGWGGRCWQSGDGVWWHGDPHDCPKWARG